MNINNFPFTALFLVYLFIYSYVHTLFGSFVPPYPLTSTLPLLPGRTCSALFSNFVEEKTEAIIRKT
jgi:hypothetical protein